MRKILLFLAVMLPHLLKLFIYRQVMGWEIGKQVKIGFSYIDCDQVFMGDNIRIRHFNIIRGLKHFQVGSNSYIANFNEFFGNNSSDEKWKNDLTLGEGVLIMSHHFIDVAGNVTIGNHTTIAGRNTHIWSHSLTYPHDIPALVPMDVSIGKEAYIGARSTLIGCSIPDRAVIGAGSVVNKSFAAESCRLLIAGNPATIKKRYDNSIVIDGQE
ncbi:MAG: DapH/DapD/GlmU-related protein [Aphanizomenon gracile PMC627.10]|nr:DapH/DapD/GlmU-related protein [Aphanizomenon gracile PMC627.10]